MWASAPLFRQLVLKFKAPLRQAISSPWAPSKSAQAERQPPFRITGLVHPPPLTQTTFPSTMICLSPETLKYWALLLLKPPPCQPSSVPLFRLTAPTAVREPPPISFFGTARQTNLLAELISREAEEEAV